MRLNILRPKEAVISAFEEPNTGVAFALILAPAIIAALLGFLSSGAVNVAGFVASAVANILLWFIVAAISYVLIFIVEGREVEGKFSGILSAFALVFGLISAVGQVIGYAAYLALPSAIKAKIMAAYTPELMAKVISEIAVQIPPITLIVALIVVAVQIVLAIISLYIIYLTIAYLVKRSTTAKIFCFVAIVIIAAIVSSAIYSIF
ncbi:MAG: hypothetical protein J7L14_01445 [Candidatus Diapherotrites archaeon]|nr:hypothetical protein [Candidatus Diapherotrites archaeon]